ncbi:hypothetical protein PIB30_077101 [Stylosanthes scabra]|uniref:Uncharacterized protein n=1 Tax=Stylosanthes scabra TaxID=79078 RepID=A0ABU6ZP47_9FABA|nr:hypothetical protein [Stylosanthes scabra]
MGDQRLGIGGWGGSASVCVKGERVQRLGIKWMPRCWVMRLVKDECEGTEASMRVCVGNRLEGAMGQRLGVGEAHLGVFEAGFLGIEKCMGKAKKGIGSKGFIKMSQKQGKLLVTLLAKLRTQHWNREQFLILSRPSCVRNFQTCIRNFLPEAFFELSGQELRTQLYAAEKFGAEVTKESARNEKITKKSLKAKSKAYA